MSRFTATTNLLRPLAIAFALAIGGRSASAQSPVVGDSTVQRDSAASLATIKVTASAAKSRLRRERQMIAGNRLLAKQLASYDKRIADLEQRLDSLRIEAAHRWKEAREMEAAAAETHERRLELERRLALLTASDTTNVATTHSPR